MLALVMVAAMVTAPAAVLGQNQSHTVEKRSINFKRGRTSAIVRGAARANKSYVYILRASHGQQMNVQLTTIDPQTTFSLIAPDTETFDDGFGVTRWAGELAETGEYKIVIVNNGEKPKVPYTLRVVVL